MISEITSEQDTLLQNYRLKWQQRARSLKPLHHPTVTETLNTAYRLSGYPEPTLFFFDNPHQAIAHLGWPTTRSPIALVMLASPIVEQIRKQFAPLLWTRFWRRIGYLYAIEAFPTENLYTTEMLPKEYYPLRELVRRQFGGMPLPEAIQNTINVHINMVSDGALLDFCITFLGCTHTMPEHWQTVTALIQNCFWHLAFEDICIVFEKPFQL
jgi:hypothetical protein